MTSKESKLRRAKRLYTHNGDRQFHKKVEKYLRLKRMSWKKDHVPERVTRELQGRVDRQARAHNKEAVREKAKTMLEEGSRTRKHISAKEYALLSRDLRRRMLREMPERVEVVA